MNTYGHVNLAAKREAMEAVGDLFEVTGRVEVGSDKWGHDDAAGFGRRRRSRPRNTQNRRSDGVCLRLVGGAPEGIRTPNLLIRSQMLYPLSYRRSSSVRLRTAQL